MENLRIPTNHIAKIFGANIGHKCLIKDEQSEDTIGIIHTVALSDELIITTNDKGSNVMEYCMFHHVSLLKRNISEISNEEAIGLYKALGFNQKDAELRLEFYTKQLMIDTILFNTSRWDFLTNANVYQYLHGIGCVLPVSLLDKDNNIVTYSTIQLIEAGIYKIIK